ncbi:MAG: AAA family ATPase [Lachnospiraceae bacterium]|nr:AAA family ATPase [Lachnospiraceae bacterium]
MRINKIHIEQFGAFSNVDLVFPQGFHSICRENGWGKTTLAVFVRVMFYGFPGKGERAKDRERYRPWGNGIYGGSLTFTTEEGCYTVYRTFGKTKARDEFHLLDEATRLESARWTASLGEELFGINEESYVNSAWIRHVGCEVSSDITSRLGKQPELLEDLKQYDQVMTRLNGRLNQLSPDRKTGLIYKKRLEKQELECEVFRIPALEKKLALLEQTRAEEVKKREELQQKRCTWKEQQAHYSLQQDLPALRSIHDRLQREYLERDEIWERYQQLYPDGLPERNGREQDSLPSQGERRQVEEQENERKSEKSKSVLCLGAGGVLVLASVLRAVAGGFSGLMMVCGVGLLLAGILLLLRERSFGQVQTTESWNQEQVQQLLLKQREEEAAYTAWKELQRADRELREFYRKYPDFEELSEGGAAGQQEFSMSQLNRQLDEVEKAIGCTEERIRTLDQELLRLSQEREDLTLAEERLDSAGQLLEKLEQEYALLGITGKHLSGAKEAFSMGFMEKIQNSFTAYYRMIDPEQREELFIDSSCRIRVMGGGLPRGPEVLSSGYQALAALCLRFAVLDAMYEQEPPCVILDDPFTALDDEKLVNALVFLRKVSKKYQILYLSCRNQ